VQKRDEELHKIVVLSLKGRDRTGNMGVDRRILIEVDHKFDLRGWSEFIWLRIGTSGGLI
jgi:hypothetical protein